MRSRVLSSITTLAIPIFRYGRQRNLVDLVIPYKLVGESVAWTSWNPNRELRPISIITNTYYLFVPLLLGFFQLILLRCQMFFQAVNHQCYVVWALANAVCTSCGAKQSFSSEYGHHLQKYLFTKDLLPRACSNFCWPVRDRWKQKFSIFLRQLSALYFKILSAWLTPNTAGSGQQINFILRGEVGTLVSGL